MGNIKEIKTYEPNKLLLNQVAHGRFDKFFRTGSDYYLEQDRSTIYAPNVSGFSWSLYTLDKSVPGFVLVEDEDGQQHVIDTRLISSKIMNVIAP